MSDKSREEFTKNLLNFHSYFQNRFTFDRALDIWPEDRILYSDLPPEPYVGDPNYYIFNHICKRNPVCFFAKLDKENQKRLLDDIEKYVKK